MKIKDWEEFQHYKSGRGAPPWIKLYRRLLDDKEWHSLPGESAKILVSCWILAAEYGGKLPDIETIAFRLRIDSKTLEKHLKNCSHWIILNEINDASKVLADSKQLATPETEKETEEETDMYSDDFLKFWKSYPKKTGKGGAYTSWKKQKPKISDVLQALSWQTIQPDWVKENGQFIPMPTTYINQRRWEDESKTPKLETALQCPKGFPFSEWMKATPQEKQDICRRNNG